MFFEPIRAQEGAVSILKRALANGRVPTAYLFTGPPGTGRKMAALAMAAGLNCQSGSTACGKCPSCLLYSSGNHPDLHIIEVPDSKRQITIDQIRKNILEKAYLMPMNGPTSTFIVNDAHMLNLNASNAFLKTLEEPPAAAHFILIAPDKDSVPPTILSRCQTLAFSPLPRQVVKDILIEEGVDREKASQLAAMARGSLEHAFRYHSSGTVEDLAQEFEPLSSLHLYGAGELLDLAQRWSRNRQDALGVLEFMAQWYRDMLILAEGVPEDQVIHIANMETLKTGAARIGGTSLCAILESVENAREALEVNSNVQLTLDTLLLKVRDHTTHERKSA